MLSEERKNKLLELSEKLKKEKKEKKKKAFRWARKNKIPTLEIKDDGTIIELMEIDDGGSPVYYITNNQGGGELLNNHQVYSEDGLTGNGQTLGIWDGGRVKDQHQEFMVNGTSRVTIKDGAAVLNFHATHVAGTMVAEGKVSNAKGMSYGGFLDAYDWNNDTGEMVSASAAGLKVSQHSYGIITGWLFSNGIWYWYGMDTVDSMQDYKWGFYDSGFARLWDVISYTANNYLIVKSAGNDRGYGPNFGQFHYYRGIVGGQWVWIPSTDNRYKDGYDANDNLGYTSMSYASLAKNIVTVGAVNSNANMASFSAWGPTNDGRIKPDIVAKGMSVYSTLEESNSDYGTSEGTSMSGPMISGSVGLILEHQNNLHPGDDLLSSTIKALIIHTANDLINGNSGGPNYEIGWGLMDTKSIIDLMTEDNDLGGKLIRELMLNNGETKEIDITTKSNGEPLKVTIVWTDPPGNPVPPSLKPKDLMLINDLDICVIDDDEKTYYPYILNPEIPSTAAINGDNFRDNVEKIVIETPKLNSNYKILIGHKGVLVDDNNNPTPQEFSLIITGI